MTTPKIRLKKSGEKRYYKEATPQSTNQTESSPVSRLWCGSHKNGHGAFLLGMIPNSQRRKQKREREREQKRAAAEWLAGMTTVHAVAPDGTERILRGEEAVEAVIRHLCEGDAQ